MIKFLACLSLLAFGTAQATVIDTTTGGYVSVSPFGEPTTATFGQTITTDSSGGYLDNFSFYMTGLSENFKAYVYAWDGFKAVGNALYDSATTNIGNPGSTFQEVTFNPNVLLAGSTQYVLFFSTAGFHDGVTNVNSWGYVDNENAYIGGSFVYDRNGNDFLQLTTNRWDSHGTDGWGDLAFKLQISAVPEPSAISAFFLGMGVVLTAFRRKHKR
ncbi:PEP-CTERM sorting domain-containing protein [Methylophilus sp. 3sh_L]|uniref:PEP-CTERM sorting domain-containing protein n=1 Tax=Methylophilus sp. 3sh_L TaxID=3377114 RepID=UPI00398E3A66